MERTKVSAEEDEALAKPQMPHTPLLDLRRSEESGSSAGKILAEMKARDSEAMVGKPRKHERAR